MNQSFYPGALVRVRSFSEIRTTLDQNGALDSLPLMPEMESFCGKPFRVFRRLEKICVEGYGARLLPRTVLLEGACCTGVNHDGCQRSCPLLWKEAWLEGVPDASHQTPPDPCAVPDTHPPLTTKIDPEHYLCQSTELGRATTYLFPLSFKRCAAEFRAGNVGFCQALRLVWIPSIVKLKSKLLGAGAVQPVGRHLRTPTEALDLQPGDLVEVKRAKEIALTLDARGRNRGLEFTPQMLPFCGNRYFVKSRVDRAILETTGRMQEFKHTVILSEVTCDGHTILGGCSRHVYHLWREIWLRKIA